MSRPGRPERPLITDGPLAELAGELRHARGRAGMTYEQLAAETGLSAATLRSAAGGTRLPTWKVTRAFAAACDGDQETLLALWTAACHAAGRQVPGQPPAEPPNPAEAPSAADLVEMLKQLRQWAGEPSLAELNRRAGGHNLLPPSTVSDMLNSQRLPRLELMHTFGRACGLDENQAAAWRDAWHLIKARESAPPPAATQSSGHQAAAQVPGAMRGRRLLSRALGVVAGVAVILSVLTAGRIIHWSSSGATSATGIQSAPALQLIYTERTANDAAVTLPTSVQHDLLQAGLAYQSIELTRVGYTGNVSASYVDMTPRTGASSTDPPLRVQGREVPAIDAKISGIQAAINDSGAATGGGRSLFTGLTRTTFTNAPVVIISTGLDLANPDNFRTLNWAVPPAVVVANVKKAEVLPTLHGRVTFVLVPTAGPQAQLGSAQKSYLEAVWTALLKASGATSVTFTDAAALTASSAAPSAPTVPVPSLPSTPIVQVPAGNNQVTCTVPDSYFVFDTAVLTAPTQTAQNLSACITAALTDHATFALDGWTSYEGPLNARGQPEFNYPYNITLSRERVQAVANLLTRDFGVPASSITRETGHGNINQPDPDPRSAGNRVVIITYTVK
jgi:transcriptional regulator with XRE-family HTH domain/outer membrane protein OmpA-like peptidoglycan-associated protein